METEEKGRRRGEGGGVAGVGGRRRKVLGFRVMESQYMPPKLKPVDIVNLCQNQRNGRELGDL